MFRYVSRIKTELFHGILIVWALASGLYGIHGFWKLFDQLERGRR